MSILRPKDGDYIVRGIFLLFCWCRIGWVPLAFLGGVIAGAGGAAFATFIALAVIGPILYWRYLKLDPRTNPQRVKLCECGHEALDHRGTLECTHGVIFTPVSDSKYGVNISGGGCQCLRYRRERWWRTNPQNPNDWSV